MGAVDRANPVAQWFKQHQDPISRSTVYDMYGRPIQPGDMIVVGNHPGEIYRVAEVKPVLRPDVPAGVLEMQLVSVILQMVQGGAPIDGLIKVRDVSEYLTPEQLEKFKQAVTGETPPTPPEGPRVSLT